MERGQHNVYMWHTLDPALSAYVCDHSRAAHHRIRGRQTCQANQIIEDPDNPTLSTGKRTAPFAIHNPIAILTQSQTIPPQSENRTAGEYRTSRGSGHRHIFRRPTVEEQVDRPHHTPIVTVHKQVRHTRPSPDQTRNRIAIQNPRPILAQSPRNRRTKPSGNIEQGRGTGTASLSTSRHTTGPRAPRRGPRPLKGGTPHAHGSAQERPGRRSFQGRGTIPYGAPQSQRCSRNPATTEGEETEQWDMKN